MKKPWNQSEPIETIFHQIEEAVEFAQHGNSPFTNNQVLNIAYYIMAQANIFKEACKEWKRAPADQKTWLNLKHYFSRPVLIGKKKVNTLHQNAVEV